MHAVSVLCPTCGKGPLDITPVVSGDDGDVVCPDCAASYSAVHGILDLIPADSADRTLAQRVMESQRFINIYEGKLFRRGPGMRAIGGISFDDELALVTRAADITHESIVLDLCSGSGLYARPLAERMTTGCVVGLDLSLPMLEYCVAHRESPAHMILIRGDACGLPFPENSFDAAISGAALHLFSPEDRADAFTEVARVLQPGARFAVAALRNWIQGAWSEWFFSKISRRTGTYYLQEKMITQQLEDAGFHDVTVHHAARYWLVMSGTV